MYKPVAEIAKRYMLVKESNYTSFAWNGGGSWAMLSSVHSIPKLVDVATADRLLVKMRATEPTTQAILTTGDFEFYYSYGHRLWCIGKGYGENFTLHQVYFKGFAGEDWSVTANGVHALKYVIAAGGHYEFTIADGSIISMVHVHEDGARTFERKSFKVNSDSSFLDLFEYDPEEFDPVTYNPT